MTQTEQLISKIEEKKYNYKAMLKSAEPNSEDFYCCRARVALCEELLEVAKTVLKKPVIEDLEKEIAKYEEYLYGFESSSRDDCIGIARHFADFGARMMKKQMVKDAIDGLVNKEKGSAFSEHRSGTILTKYFELGKLRCGDTVKVIILKDD